MDQHERSKEMKHLKVEEETVYVGRCNGGCKKKNTPPGRLIDLLEAHIISAFGDGGAIVLIL